MRWALLFGICGICAACLTGRHMVVTDDRFARDVEQQLRWTDAALKGRPDPGTIERIRQSDYEAVRGGRAQLRRLATAIERATWVRDSAADALRGGDEDAILIQDFDRAGRLRGDSVAAAAELADALSQASGALKLGELQPVFDSIRRAQASEQRLQPALVSLKLPAAAVQVPPGLVDAAARVVHEHGDDAPELARLPPDVATKIRARAADAELSREEQKHTPPQGPITAADAARAQPPTTEEPGQGTPAAAPPDTLRFGPDAQKLLHDKGAPRSIQLRADGLFALAWDDGVWLLDPDGKLVRKEAVQR